MDIEQTLHKYVLLQQEKNTNLKDIEEFELDDSDIDPICLYHLLNENVTEKREVYRAISLVQHVLLLSKKEETPININIDHRKGNNELHGHHTKNIFNHISFELENK